jgi:hypothetical protein
MVIVFATLAGVALVPSVSSQEVIGSDVLIVNPVADSFVNESSPDTNYGDLNWLDIKCNSYHQYTYIMFDLSGLPSDANIIAASLGLTITSISGSGELGVHIGAHYCSDDSWNETGITWNHKPFFEPEATATNSYAFVMWVPARRWWNTTVDVRTAFGLDKKLTEVILFEEPETDHGYVSFRSKEVAGVELKIEYTTRPIYTVQFESIQDTRTTSNLGNLNFSSRIMAFPSDWSIVDGSYEVEYQGGYTFLRWEVEGGVSVSDMNAQETSVTVSGSGKLRAVGSAQIMQYSFDDSVGESSTFQTVGEMVAVRFTPLFLGSLKSARFYISSDYDHAFNVHVMDANLSDVIQPFSQSASSNGWFEVDLSGYDVSVRGDFYIAMEWLTDYDPGLGVDGSSPDDRSFEWNGTAWLARSQDYMIRAVVESTVPIRPIGVISCLPLSSYVSGGENVTVSGSIAPLSIGVEVNVTYVRPDGSTVVRKALTNTTGAFADTFMPDKVGLWKAMASWSGNEDCEGSASFPEEFTVSMGTSYVYFFYLYQNKITIGSAINLTGHMSPRRFASIDLEYSLDQAQTWTTFASVNTTGDGEYSYVWTPVSVGTYIVRAAWRGDEVCTGSNSTGAMLTVEETKKSFRTYVDWRGFDIEVACNSTVSDFVFDQAQMMISFQLTGVSQTVGYCNVSFPKELLGGPYDIQVEDSPVTHYEASNGQMFLHFTFNFQSTCNVKIVGQTVIPEFSSTVLPVFMIAALFAVILGACRQRSRRQDAR